MKRRALRGWCRPVGLWACAMFVAFSGRATAQLGDKADRPEDVQKPVVPRELIPPAPPLSPPEALKTFRVAPGVVKRIRSQTAARRTAWTEEELKEFPW